MAATPVSKKLQIKPGHQVRLLNAPAGAADLLGPLPDGARLSFRSASPADVAILFVHNLADAQANSPAAFAAVRPKGLVWIC